MSERRVVARHRTFLKGRLMFNNGNSSEDCLVRDLTEQGAQIELPHPHAPQGFDLAIPVRGLRAGARVAWKNGARLGVRFEPGETAREPVRRAASQRDDGRY